MHCLCDSWQELGDLCFNTFKVALHEQFSIFIIDTFARQLLDCSHSFTVCYNLTLYLTLYSEVMWHVFLCNKSC